MLFNHRNFLMMLGIAMLALNTLPILSAHCEGSESCTLMVRGYNLLEFSSWAAVPVFSVIIILAILFSLQKKSAKNVELILLLVANAVCYVESLRVARAWLDGISNAPINCHFGMIAFPVGVVLIVFYAMLFVNDLKIFKTTDR